MRMGSQVTAEVWYLDADHPEGKFKLIAARKQDVEYDVTHHHGKFLILTNENAKNFKLMQVSVVRSLNTKSQFSSANLFPC